MYWNCASFPFASNATIAKNSIWLVKKNQDHLPLETFNSIQFIYYISFHILFIIFRTTNSQTIFVTNLQNQVKLDFPWKLKWLFFAIFYLNYQVCITGRLGTRLCLCSVLRFSYEIPAFPNIVSLTSSCNLLCHLWGTSCLSLY